jgi:twitching motility protein PilU
MTGAEMDITKYLEIMAQKGASDLFFSVGAPVNIKIKGLIQPLDDQVLVHGTVEKLAFSLISDAQRVEFENNMELNFAHDISGVGRFRINLYRQRGEVSMVIRYIKSSIPTMEELHLPEILKTLVMEARGLVLVVGATGSGKSTTLASMIDYRNAQQSGHILTIEDPIEYLYTHRKAVVDQREIGLDTLSYDNALKNAMREAPDVILIGEIRERATMQHAIAYAETGHLCLSTLHANNANQTIDRIVNFFPENAQRQLLIDLSLNLKAVISQRLLPGVDGSLVPAFEIMLRSAYIAELIEKQKIDELKEAIAASREIGMQTFDQSLYDLYTAGKITEQVVLDHADSKTNISLKINLERGATPGDDHNLSLKKFDL